MAFDNFSPLSNYHMKLMRANELRINDVDLLKKGRVKVDNAEYHYADLCDIDALDSIFSQHRFDGIIHLAALTGVRQSVQNPQAYIDANVKGFVNMAECAKKYGVKNFIYASSSSVYGANKETPYKEDSDTSHPISAYAASKKACELLAHTYYQLYGMNMVGLRFFTVYGPWTRPDMAAYIFMKAIAEGREIDLFNEGKMVRDFTYVGDIVKAIDLLLQKMNNTEGPLCQIFNIGNHKPVYTIDFLRQIETAMQQKAKVVNKEIQPGDMLATNAEVEKLYRFIGFRPQTLLDEGVKTMVNWFKHLNG